MAKKKIKDLTLGEIKDICSKKNCMDCLFAQFVTMGEECPITDIGINILMLTERELNSWQRQIKKAWKELNEENM